MTTILQATFSNVCSWMELFEFSWNLTVKSSQGANRRYTSFGWDNGLESNRPKALIWTKDSLNYWRISDQSALVNASTLTLYSGLNFPPGNTMTDLFWIVDTAAADILTAQGAWIRLEYFGITTSSTFC